MTSDPSTDPARGRNLLDRHYGDNVLSRHLNQAHIVCVAVANRIQAHMLRQVQKRGPVCMHIA